MISVNIKTKFYNFRNRLSSALLDNSWILFTFSLFALSLRYNENSPGYWYWGTLLIVFMFTALIEYVVISAVSYEKFVFGDAIKNGGPKDHKFEDALNKKLYIKNCKIQDLTQRRFGLLAMAVLIFWNSGIDNALKFAFENNFHLLPVICGSFLIITVFQLIWAYKKLG